MKIIDCSKGEGLVIGDEIFINVEDITVDSVRFDLEVNEDATIRLAEYADRDDVKKIAA